MDGGKKFPSPGQLQYFSPAAGDKKSTAHEALGGGGSQGYDNLRIQNIQLCFQPRAAGGDLAGVWLFVKPALPKRLPFEMLHRIGDVDASAINPSFLQRLIKNAAGRSDKRMSFQVFPVARFFADQHHLRIFRAFAKYGLRALFPKRAGLAFCRRPAKFSDGGISGNQRRCRFRDAFTGHRKTNTMFALTSTIDHKGGRRGKRAAKAFPGAQHFPQPLNHEEQLSFSWLSRRENAEGSIFAMQWDEEEDELDFEWREEEEKEVPEGKGNALSRLNRLASIIFLTLLALFGLFGLLRLAGVLFGLRG